ncbi:MAG: metal-dependent hydrolase [Methanomassiliicoccales archaeon]
MLLLCHLFVGLLIGLALYRWSGDRRMVPMAGLGGVLPDLVDKPLGHIILQSSVDYGRIYCHGLFLVVGLLAMGAVLHRTRFALPLLALGLALLSHQLLDMMWNEPVSWLYPLLGPYGQHHFPNYFQNGFWTEITSPSEWLFLALSGAILVRIHGAEGTLSWLIRPELDRLAHWIIRAGPAVAVLLSALLLAMSVQSVPDSPVQAQQQALLGLISLTGGLVLEEWRPSLITR